MKNVFFFLALVMSASLFTACGDDDDQMDDPQYSINILEPNTDDKHLNDNIHIHVEFKSATNQTVHHVNVRIYNKADNSIVAYDRSTENGKHVHAESGIYEWHHDLGLTADNNFAAHTDWILEAKVWGHEAGVAEVVKEIEFHVHPE